MAGSTTKGGAMGLAMILVTAGVQQALTGGEPVVGGALTVIGIAIAIGYQFVENQDHSGATAAAYNDVVEAIGEENFRELAEFSADEFRRLKADLRDDQ